MVLMGWLPEDQNPLGNEAAVKLRALLTGRKWGAKVLLVTLHQQENGLNCLISKAYKTKIIHTQVTTCLIIINLKCNILLASQ